MKCILFLNYLKTDITRQNLDITTLLRSLYKKEVCPDALYHVFPKHRTLLYFFKR